MAQWSLVIGGSGGIGRAISRQLAADGWNVGICHRSGRAAAQELAAEITAQGGSAECVELDLGNPESVRSAVDDFAAAHGLHGLVYAAGPPFRLEYVSQIEVDAFARVMEVEVTGAFAAVRAALPHLRETRGPVTSLVTPVIDHYAKLDALSGIPKSALRTLIRAVAVEEGRFGIRANAVGVGLIEGEGMWKSLSESGDYTPEGLEHARRSTPLRRFGTPEDIAHAISFLMSERASWITGQTLHVDGGFGV